MDAVRILYVHTEDNPLLEINHGSCSSIACHCHTLTRIDFNTDDLINIIIITVIIIIMMLSSPSLPASYLLLLSAASFL